MWLTAVLILGFQPQYHAYETLFECQAGEARVRAVTQNVKKAYVMKCVYVEYTHEEKP